MELLLSLRILFLSIMTVVSYNTRGYTDSCMVYMIIVGFSMNNHASTLEMD